MASSWSNPRNRESTRADLSTILEKAHACTGTSGIAIALKTDRPAEIECYARIGPTSPPLGIAALEEGSLTAYCLRTGERLLCLDATADPRVASTSIVELGIRSLALTPILLEGRTIGVLTAFADVANAFSLTHLGYLETASRQVSKVLETQSRTDAALAVKAQEVKPVEVNLFASLYGPTRDFRTPRRSLILQSAILVLLLVGGLATWGYRAIPKKSSGPGTNQPAPFTAFAATKTSGVAGPPATLTIDPKAVIVHPLDNFTLHVNVSAVPDKAFVVAMQVKYDPDLMQFIDVTQGAEQASTADQGLLAHRDDPLTGTLKISAQRPGHSDRGVVVGLVFRAKGTGNTKVLVASGARDDQGQHVDVSDANVAVTIN